MRLIREYWLIFIAELQRLQQQPHKNANYIISQSAIFTFSCDAMLIHIHV